MRWVLVVKPPFERPEPFFRVPFAPAFSSPLCARRQMMGTDDSLSFEPDPGSGHGATFIERLRDRLPQAGRRPAPELAIDTRPRAKLFGRVTPGRAGSGYPEYGIRNSTTIRCRSPTMPRMAIKNGSKNAHSAFSINNQAAIASSKGSLKHISADLEIQSVNMT